MPAYDVTDLCSAIRHSRERLSVVRASRYAIAKECAGNLYARAADKPVKVNLLSLFYETFSNLLVANEPRYLLSTADIAFRASVRIEQDWLNEQSARMALGDTGKGLVGDALMGTGICKVALATPCDAAKLAWGITAGEPVTSLIDLDDFVYNTSARTFETAAWLGHFYRCPVSVAKKMYKRRITDNDAEEFELYNESAADPKIDQLFHGNMQPEEFEKHVELFECWLPRHKVILTLSKKDILEGGRDGAVKPLWTQPWVGHPDGPYVFLTFGRNPGAAIGKAPMMDLYELHCDYNNVHRKVDRTLKNLKENILFRRSNSKDAEELQKANHLDYVPCEDPESIKAISLGGQLVQPLLTAANVIRQLFDFLAGNLSLLRGSAAQSRTATQDKILAQNSGMGVQAMQGKVETAMAKIGERMLWYAHYHPQLVMESEYKVPGHRGANRLLHPPGSPIGPARNFPFSRTKMRLDPYSIRHKTPEERLAFIQGIVGQLMPLMPILAQSGTMLDANALIEIQSELGDEPRLKDIFTVQEPPQAEPGQGPAGLPHTRMLPTQTERTYNRRDVSQPQSAESQLAEMPSFSSNGEAA